MLISARILAVVTLVVLMSLWTHALAQDAARDNRTHLAGEIELARLIDLCAERLGMRFEYDAAQLRGAVTLRIPDGVSDEELWALTSRALAARGLTTVLSLDSGVLSVMKITDAGGAARLQVDGALTARDGYVTTVVRLQRASAKAVAELLKPLFSPSGNAIALGESGLLMISDLKPRVEDALALIELIDVPSEAPVVEVIRAQHVGATQLAATILSAVTVRDVIAGTPLKGKIAAAPDGNALVLVAPGSERDFFIALIATFDVPQPIERRTYLPGAFSPAEVARLIEQTAREAAPRGAGEKWSVVTDQLTGTIFVSATPEEHARIDSLLERLHSMPASARRPMRAFPVRNRPVIEILAVVEDLISAGALESTLPDQRTDARQPAAQRSERNGLQSTPGMTPGTSPGSLVGVQAQPTRAQPAESSGSTTASPVQAGEVGLSLTADEATNTLIAIGDGRQLDALRGLIEDLDRRQPQVMLDVLAVSLTDDETLDLGAELQKLEVSGTTIVHLASLFGLSSISPASSATSASGAGFTGVILDPGSFSVVIRALETLNEGRSLTMPRVLVSNNQQATINSVLQQPFVSVNASDTIATTSFGGTQDAGTTVSVRPQIAEGDHLVLEYSVAISNFVGEAISDNVPPPRQQNTLQSMVTIPDGYTIVVGGLEITTDAKGESRIPFLGSLPGVGELFKNRSNSATRSRFFVFIRPTVLRHNGFEDLKYLSERDWNDAAIHGADAPHFRDAPEVEPRVIR
jgi:general secretion pathway protein D